MGKGTRPPRRPRLGTGAGLADVGTISKAKGKPKPDAASLAALPDRREPWERLELTWPQELFCRELAADPRASGVAAAQRVAAWTGRSKGALRNVSHNLMKRPTVRQRVAQLRREALAAVERSRRTKLTARRVVRELTALGLSDVRKLLTVDGDGVTVKPSSEWPDEAAAAVAAVVNTPDGVKLQLHDKGQALARLMKYLRLLPEPVPIAGGGIEIGRAMVYIPENGRDLQRPLDRPDTRWDRLPPHATTPANMEAPQ